MKKVFISVAFLLPLISSCSNEDDFVKEENTFKTNLLRECCRSAFETHIYMQADGYCDGTQKDCCWEFVPEVLRLKYENGSQLSEEEMLEIVNGLQSCHNFDDTLGELDCFFDLCCI